VTTRTRKTLVGLGIGLALADSSVVTLALPDILRQFDVEIPTVAWVLTSYNLWLALAALPAAYAARRRPSRAPSRRRSACSSARAASRRSAARCSSARRSTC
jgi:MFS family permease